jgi:hypothetical protein
MSEFSGLSIRLPVIDCALRFGFLLVNPVLHARFCLTDGLFLRIDFLLELIKLLTHRNSSSPPIEAVV